MADDSNSENFVPYISPESSVKEITIKSVILGLALAAMMAAANAYLGLYVGMTVSAAIPAAVIAMAILKPFKGTVLEVNVAETFAAAGEALAAGVIFTIPALLILHEATGGMAGWSSLVGVGQYAVIGIVAFIGGILGVLFTIPLRRILIVDLKLKYPEGVACGEVLKAGDKGGSEMIYILLALGMGGAFKFLASEFGLSIFRERMLMVLWPKGLFSEGGAVNDVQTGPYIPLGTNVSPALAAVGYIIGLKVALMIFSGAMLGWLICLPIVSILCTNDVDVMLGPIMLTAFNWDAYTGSNPVDRVFYVWRNYTMYIGIGAIVVGGLWTLWKMRDAIIKGVGESFKSTGDKASTMIRTETDFPFKKFYFIVIPIVMATFYFGFFMVGGMITNPIVNFLISAVLAVILFIFAFFFTAVAGYIAGVLGSSNNPISGVTVTTLLFTAILMKLASVIPFGPSTYTGMAATIIVAGVVCCSAAIAGDCMQNMKVGQILGSTPRSLQIAEFGGVIITAFVIGGVLIAMDVVYGIGSDKLPAPQAYVMAGVVQGVMTFDVPWVMLAIGVALALVLIILELTKVARLSIMAIAIGIYLPVTLSVPIVFGGIVKTGSEKFIETKMPSKEDADKAKEDAESLGVLFASGLIAGEAVMGVLIAVMVIVLIFAGQEADFFALIHGPNPIPGMIVLLYILALMLYIALRKVLTGQKS